MSNIYNSEYHEFYEAIKKAETNLEQRLLAHIETAAHSINQWTAAAWLLERRFPARWGKLSSEALLAQYADRIEQSLSVEEEEAS